MKLIRITGNKWNKKRGRSGGRSRGGRRRQKWDRSGRSGDGRSGEKWGQTPLSPTPFSPFLFLPLLYLQIDLNYSGLCARNRMLYRDINQNSLMKKSEIMNKTRFLKKTILQIVLLVLFTWPLAALAQLSVPQKINVQAIVRDSSGIPVTQSYSAQCEVSLWTAELDGTKVWVDDTINIEVVDGLTSFSLNVDSNVFAANPVLWLEVLLSDDLIVERRQVASVGYAYYADRSASTDVLPPGMISSFFGASAPTGWLIADGSTIDKSTHPEYGGLVDHLRALGGDYTASDENQANLPDLRGVFLRGQDKSAGLNPNKGDDAIGRYQADNHKSHDHSASSGNAGNHSHTPAPAGGHSHTGNTGSGGSHSHTLGFDYGGTFSVLLWGGGSSGDNMANSVMGETLSDSWRFPFVSNTTGSHTHSFSTGSVSNHSHAANSGGDHSHTVSVGAQGGDETRPKNITVLHVIKY